MGLSLLLPVGSRRRTWAGRAVQAVRVPLGTAYRRLRYAGSARLCALCGGRFRRFLPYGVVPRPDALCPGCGSLERQRLLWLYLSTRTELLRRPARLLHFAPEQALARRLARLGDLQYVTADLEMPTARIRLDLVALPYSDGCFDAVLCSHVLEHVPDDAAALREMLRVLRPGGVALIQVPLRGERTYEDWSQRTPEQRLAAFGQSDHVRVYGRDVRARLEAVGFDVQPVENCLGLAAADVERHGLDADEPLWVCRRPATQHAAGAA